jgi:hypothetical protein
MRLGVEHLLLIRLNIQLVCGCAGTPAVVTLPVVDILPIFTWKREMNKPRSRLSLVTPRTSRRAVACQSVRRVLDFLFLAVSHSDKHGASLDLQPSLTRGCSSARQHPATSTRVKALNRKSLCCFNRALLSQTSLDFRLWKLKMILLQQS